LAQRKIKGKTITQSDHDVARCAVLTTTGLGLGAGLVAGLAPTQADAAKRDATASDKIWSAEYWAKKGDVALNLWRKRVGAPKSGEKPLPILFLVHGSSNSARSSYDLTVPGKGEYSLVNVMARYGYDIWTTTVTAARAAPATIPTSPAVSRTLKRRFQP
jgi:hypothetical protein